MRVSFAGIAAGEDIGYNVLKSITHGLDTLIEGLIELYGIVEEGNGQIDFFSIFSIFFLYFD
jgi:hypothetical protein